MSSTPLLAELVRLGAKLAAYGEHELPESFAGPAEELRALGERWAFFDQSHFGRLELRGEDRAAFLHNLTTNDVRGLTAGEGNLAVVPNVKGRIVDLASVHCLPQALLVVTQPASRAAVLKHLDFYHFMEDVEIEDLTERTALVAVAGPESEMRLGSLAGPSLAAGLRPHAHVLTELAGHDVRVIRHDRFGHRGFRLWCQREAAPAVLGALVGAGAAPVGETALERMRLAAGEPAFGPELNEERNPLEAGLYSAVSFTKGCYLGQEVVARLDTYKKVARFLTHVRLPSEAEPLLCGRPRLFLRETEVGWLTSWAPAPEGDGFWALGYTSRRCQDAGLTLEAQVPVRALATLTRAEGTGGADPEDASCG
jgi:tRNA-modifying protein YgfZ